MLGTAEPLDPILSSVVSTMVSTVLPNLFTAVTAKYKAFQDESQTITSQTSNIVILLFSLS